MTTTDIVASIDQRLIEAKAEIAQLEGARPALIHGAMATVTPKPRRAPRRAAARQTAAAKYKVVPAGRLTALLRGSAGKVTPEAGPDTHREAEQIVALLRELEKADQIRRTGERRATRWHLITDEDRIAARAAEIA